VRSSRARRADIGVAALLAALPLAALFPAIAEGRLLAPGDGFALHYPLRAAAWEALESRRVPGWNHDIFGGTPLLAAFRPGAIHPLMLGLAPLPPFIAFQTLVVVSLALAALLVYLYLRRIRCGHVGAYFGAVSFALGPYLIGHLADTSTLVGAPALVLLLLAAEALLERPGTARFAGLAASLALLLLSGSFEAAGAGLALLAGRLLAAPLGLAQPVGMRAVGMTCAACVAGALLAAPQLIPAALAFSDAGPLATGLAEPPPDIRGAPGLVVRYVSHTPAGALALSVVPLVLRPTALRTLVVAACAWLGLSWVGTSVGAPGSFALLFDLTLSLLAGLALSIQWRARRDRLGGRLRAYFLFCSLASAAALSAAATAGPLPQSLASSVGLLALALVLHFSLARSQSAIRAHLWLLPLTVSFLLQPQGRGAWEGAPTRKELESGTPTSLAIDRALGQRRDERLLTLVQEWPRDALDLGYANLSALSGRRTANGYDPMTPLRYREAFEGMGPEGVLSPELFRTDPRRLELLGVSWVQVPTAALADSGGDAEVPPLALPVEQGRPRFLPLPIVPATEIEVRTEGPADAIRVAARLATGRVMPTAGAGGEGVLGFRLPGRYFVDGVLVDAATPRSATTLIGVSAIDGATGAVSRVSSVSAYVSDRSRFRESASTPFARLFEVTASPGPSHVAEALWVVPSDAAVLGGLRAIEASGLHPLREALAVSRDVEGVLVPEGSRAARARVARSGGGRLDVRAPGPGVLVVAEGWDPGWSAEVDGVPARVLRVNHVQLAVVLGPGLHRVVLSYAPRGFQLGLLLAGCTVVVMIALPFRRRRAGSR